MRERSGWRLWGTVSTLLVLPGLQACGWQPRAAAPSSKSVGFCVDVTRSLPHDFVRTAQEHVADDLERLVNPPFGQLKVYIRTIRGNSYSPDAEVLAFELAALGPSPGGDINQYDRSAKSDHDAASARWSGELAQRRSVAAQQAERLRALTLPRDDRTDPVGCLAKLADLHVDEATVISDLKPHDVPADWDAPDLDGAHLTVVFYCDDRAVRCERRRDRWSRFLQRTGVTLAWVDPSEPSPW